MPRAGFGSTAATSNRLVSVSPTKTGFRKRAPYRRCAQRRHRHHQQAMRQPLSETCLGGIRIVVVDRMVVAGHIGKSPELIISNSTGFTDECLSYRQIISKDLCRSPISHFGFSPFACTTTGSSLRVRSLWISTILAD